MVEKQRDSISVEKNDDLLTIHINCPATFEIKDTKNNLKVLYILLRLFKSQKGKNLVTFSRISALFGLKSRQDSNNFYRDFLASGEDILHFLQRKKKLNKAFPIIEKQILANPLLPIGEHFKEFLRCNPEFKMTEATFKSYASRIDALKIKKRYDQLITKKEIKPDKERFLKEIIEEEATSTQQRKTILSVFPELQQEQKEVVKEASFLSHFDKFGKNIIVMYLIACGLNYQTLGLLMGVSKATIHNVFYSLSFLKRLLLNSIKWWSGEIATDEKWLKINKKWYYVISIVDNRTGFPLYFQVVSDLTASTWKIFFQRFYKIYGKPRLIISDGSGSIAKALKDVFPDSNHQLCKFHKLKNLTKRIYQSHTSSKEKKKMFRLVNGIFKNTTYFGRKRAARKLIEISPDNVSKYVENSILEKWNQLTKGYTSNSAERWNRKIEKVTQGRYGLKSEKFVVQLITSLWLKEAVQNKIHLRQSFVHNVNIRRLSQENLQMCNVIELFKHKLLGKVA